MLACGLLTGLSGCGVLRETFGAEKHSPDEFAVVRNVPLVVPPDFELRPPRPGEKRPQEMDSQARAIAALFPGRTSLPAQSAGEMNLLQQAGAAGDLAAVRSTLSDDDSLVADKGFLLRELLSTESGLVDTEGTKVEHIGSEPLK
ncbi:MAG: hypothetical protein Tsb0016_14110 [Sphingomonadales bacterium]